MNYLKLFSIALLIPVLMGCDEKVTETNSEKIKFLTDGIWEISGDTEVGQVGVRIKYYSDGRAQVRENASSNWYPDYFQWSISDDGEEFTMNGTNGPGTFDKIKILELTNTVCRGRIISSSSSSAVNKIIKMFKTGL
jgi:hypothetical protein